MNIPLLRTSTLALIALISLLGGFRVLRRVRGRQDVGQKPLNQRFGYGLDEVRSYWGAFDESGRRAEAQTLRLDLAFPLLYGGTLAASLLSAWSSLGRNDSLAWILAPLAITVVADWTENLVHLEQLKRFMAHGRNALQENRLRLASTATRLKLSFLFLSWMTLLGLIVALLWKQ